MREETMTDKRRNKQFTNEFISQQKARNTLKAITMVTEDQRAQLIP